MGADIRLVHDQVSLGQPVDQTGVIGGVGTEAEAAACGSNTHREGGKRMDCATAFDRKRAEGDRATLTERPNLEITRLWHRTRGLVWGKEHGAHRCRQV